jgi:hypothetical protein
VRILDWLNEPHYFESKVGVAVVRPGLFAVYPVLARSGLGADIGRRVRVASLLRIALAAGVADTKIVLSVLVEILGGNPIVAGCRFPCKGDVSLEYLLRRATHPDLGAVAVKGLTGLRNSWLRSERPVWVKAAARALIGS